MIISKRSTYHRRDPSREIKFGSAVDMPALHATYIEANVWNYIVLTFISDGERYYAVVFADGCLSRSGRGLSLSTKKSLSRLVPTQPPQCQWDPDDGGGGGSNTVANLCMGGLWDLPSSRHPPAWLCGQGMANLINAPAAPHDDLFLSRPLADQHIRPCTTQQHTLDYHHHLYLSASAIKVSS